VNPTNPTARTSITLTLTTDAAAEATGREVVQQIADACTENDYETLSTLHVLFTNIVPRVPEFHPLMDELVAADNKKVIWKLLRFPNTREHGGRPREDEFYFVALIERVMENRKAESATDAISWIVGEHKAGRLPLPAALSAKTLQNQHAKLGELFRLWSGSIYVPPDLLTMIPWMPPGIALTPEKIDACRYPPTAASLKPETLKNKE
jgi:hypothetical protein